MAKLKLAGGGINSIRIPDTVRAAVTATERAVPVVDLPSRYASFYSIHTMIVVKDLEAETYSVKGWSIATRGMRDGSTGGRTTPVRTQSNFKLYPSFVQDHNRQELMALTIFTGKAGVFYQECDILEEAGKTKRVIFPVEAARVGLPRFTEINPQAAKLLAAVTGLRVRADEEAVRNTALSVFPWSVYQDSMQLVEACRNGLREYLNGIYGEEGKDCPIFSAADKLQESMYLLGGFTPERGENGEVVSLDYDDGLTSPDFLERAGGNYKNIVPHYNFLLELRDRWGLNVPEDLMQREHTQLVDYVSRLANRRGGLSGLTPRQDIEEAAEGPEGNDGRTHITEAQLAPKPAPVKVADQTTIDIPEDEPPAPPIVAVINPPVEGVELPSPEAAVGAFTNVDGDIGDQPNRRRKGGRNKSKVRTKGEDGEE